jgi:hypothetical protein
VSNVALKWWLHKHFRCWSYFTVEGRSKRVVQSKFGFVKPFVPLVSWLLFIGSLPRTCSNA